MAFTPEQRRAKGKIYRDRWYAGIHAAPFHLDSRPDIPARVLADRDRRRDLAPRTTTAALMGDPLPGRSALDRK